MNTNEEDVNVSIERGGTSHIVNFVIFSLIRIKLYIMRVFANFQCVATYRFS